MGSDLARVLGRGEVGAGDWMCYIPPKASSPLAAHAYLPLLASTKPRHLVENEREGSTASLCSLKPNRGWRSTAHLPHRPLPSSDRKLLAAPAQFPGPDLFFKPVVGLLIGPELLQLDRVFDLAPFFSAVSILDLCS